MAAEKRIDRIQSKVVTTLNPDPHQAQTPNIDNKPEQQVANEEDVARESPASPIPVVSDSAEWWDFIPF